MNAKEQAAEMMTSLFVRGMSAKPGYILDGREVEPITFTPRAGLPVRCHTCGETKEDCLRVLAKRLDRRTGQKRFRSVCARCRSL